MPELNGIALTQSALQSEVGSTGPIFVAIAIFLFAFSSIIGNYYYGEANIRFITPNAFVMTLYRLCSGGLMIIFGALASFELVWNIVDLFMAFLTACNLVAIVLLGRYAFRLFDDYRRQSARASRSPSSTAVSCLNWKKSWIAGKVNLFKFRGRNKKIRKKFDFCGFFNSFAPILIHPTLY